MAVGVAPHYRSCLLTWYLTIGHAFVSIATATECGSQKDGYKTVSEYDQEIPQSQTANKPVAS